MIEFRRGKPVDVATIDRFEADFGVRFPQVYRDILLAHDGARPFPSSFEATDTRTGRSEWFGFVRMIRLGRDGAMFGKNSGGVAELPAKMIVFGDDGTGVHIAFDYRASTIPSVVAVMPDRSGEAAIIPLADNIEAFLDGLQVPPELGSMYRVSPAT